MRSVRRGGLVALLVLLISQMLVTPSFAIGVSGSTPFGLSPSPDSNGLPRSYFVLQVAPGHSVSDSVVVSDQGRNGETLLISPATGVTATNSGTAFQGAFSPCSGSACWITGLPTSVTLSAGESKTLPFTVNVPANALPSQYLAGITVKPAQAPSATNIGGNQQTSVNAIIIHEITIGVAISTGDLAQLSSKLVITGVTGSLFGTVSRLLVTVRNEGQRYAHGTGTATCTVNGQQKSLPVNVNTVLPGESAVVPVNAGEFGTASHCFVQLGYGGAAAAAWTGSVKIPVAAPAHLVPIAKGVYAALPAAKIPSWAVALLIAAGALVLLLLTLLLLQRRRRRRRRAGALASTQATTSAAPPRPHEGAVTTAVTTEAAPPVTSSSLHSSQATSVGDGGVGALATETRVAPSAHEDLEATSTKKAAKSPKKSAKRSAKKNR